MPYIGHAPTNAGTFYVIDDLTMSSSTTYTLQVGSVSVTPRADNLLITLDGVIQHNPDAYTVSGSTLTFASAPGSGVDFYGIIMGQSASHGQGSIGAAELKVTGNGAANQFLAGDADGSFTFKDGSLSTTTTTGDILYRANSSALARLAIGSTGQVLTVASGIPAWSTDTEAYLPSAGGTMSGNIAMGSNDISGGGTITGTFVGGITGNVTGNTSGTALTVTQAAQSAITSVGTLTTLTVDDITLNGSTITDGGDFTLDVGGRIDLSADDNGEIRLFDGSSMYAQFKDDDDRLKIQGLLQDKDIMIVGNDGGSEVTALMFDISEAGNATFSGNVASFTPASGGSQVIFSESGGSQAYLYSGGSASVLRTTSSTPLQFSANYSSGYDFQIGTDHNATFAGDIDMTGGQKKMKLHNSSNTVSSMLRISNRDTFPSSGAWADEYICEIHGATSGSNSEVLMFLQHHENGGDRPILRAKNSTDHVIELGSNELYKFRGKLSVGNTIFDASEPLHVKGTSGNIYARIETTAANSAAGIYIIGTSTDESRIFMGDENGSTQGRIIYKHATDSMEFWANDTKRMNLTSGGALQLGDFDSEAHFQVKANYANEHLVKIWADGDHANRYGMIVKCGEDSGQGELITFQDGNGDGVGSVTFSGSTVSYGTFTANHEASLPTEDADSKYPYGTLVEIVSLYYKQKNGADSERGIRYNVKKTSSAYSKKVLGSYSDYMKSNPEGEANLHKVDILGDGHILCNGEKGNIEIGDGICSSSTDGEGMKADKMAMIIGIAQEDVSFSGSESKLVAVQYGLQQFTPWENA